MPRQCCSVCGRPVDWDTIDHWLVAPFVCPDCRHAAAENEPERQLALPGVEPPTSIRLKR